MIKRMYGIIFLLFLTTGFISSMSDNLEFSFEPQDFSTIKCQHCPASLQLIIVRDENKTAEFLKAALRNHYDMTMVVVCPSWSRSRTALLDNVQRIVQSGELKINDPLFSSFHSNPEHEQVLRGIIESQMREWAEQASE